MPCSEEDCYNRPLFMHWLGFVILLLFVVGCTLYGVGLNRDLDLKKWHTQYAITNCSLNVIEIATCFADSAPQLMLNTSVETSGFYYRGVPSSVQIGSAPVGGEDLRVAGMCVYIPLIFAVLVFYRANQENNFVEI